MNESQNYDVAVIGVGAMGAATCEALSRRGVSVVGVERFAPVHEMGSSGGETRLIRKAYFEHPDYVPLLVRAYQNWAELEERCERKLLYETGCLYFGAPESELIAGTIRSATEHDLAIKELGVAECKERFPQFTLDGVCGDREPTVLWDSDAGVLLCEQAIEAQIEGAEANGAHMRFSEQVLSWREHATGGVTISTDSGTISAGHVVFTAGAWTQELLSTIDLQLSVHRQVLSWTTPDNPERYSVDRYPAWLEDLGTDVDCGHTYGFPLMPKVSKCPLSEVALKVGFHYPGDPTSPDAVDRSARAQDDLNWRDTVDKLIPGAGPTRASKVCLYTMSPDEHFIVDRHPLHRNVTLAAGFSGHGYKFASVIGEILADLATAGQTDQSADFLGLQRFT